MNEMTQILGIVAMEPKGEWDSETYYEKLNTVLYNDSTYMAKEGVVGENPSTSDKWQLIGGGVTKEYVASKIVDNLDSSDSTKMLSAKQGKILNEEKQNTYSNVASMIADTNLKDGMIVKTLGYTSSSDNGGARYVITSIESANDFQEELENGKYATLIIEDNININALGADNTGANDSSTIFNKAFQYINSLWLSGNYKINTVVCEGKYLWTSQVIMPPCARLYGNGYTTILTNVTGSALKIDYLSNNFPQNFAGNKQDWQWAELINFERGGLFKNVGTNLTNTCIEIGTSSERTTPSGNLAYCRYKLCNFRIYNYNIGLVHNRYHIFMGKYENISFEANNTGVQFGESTTTSSTDCGENFTFINCLFASGTNGIMWNVSGWDVSVLLSSFDYLTNCVVKNVNSGYSKFSATGCHFEGFSKLLKGFKNNDVISITQSTLMFNRNGDIFDGISTGQGATYISLSNNKLMPIGTPTDPAKCLSLSNINLVYGYNYVGNDTNYYGFKNANLINTFDGLTDGTVSVANNAEIGIWKVITSGDYTGSIVTDDYLYEGHKSLVLTSTVDTAAKKNFGIQTKDFIPINVLKGCLFGNIFKYNMQGGGSFTYYFYDEDQQLISNTSGYHYQPGASTPNTWYIPTTGVRGYIPANAKYFKVAVTMSNINAETADPIGTEYKIGGIIIN